MENSNNPAGRLHALLHEGQSKQKNKAASEILAEILEIPKEDTGLLLRRVGHVLSLPSSVKEAMSYIDDLDNNIYLRWLPRVETSFTTLNFQVPWKQFIDRFDGEIMYGIEICSDRLSKERPEKTTDEKSLVNLLGKVNELLSELNNTELDGNVWFYIYDHLIKIKEAIEEYKIRGIKPLEAVFEQAVGGVVLSPELYKNSQKSPNGKRFWEVMGHLAIVVTITAGSIQIGKEIVSILSPPQADDQSVIEHPKVSNEGNSSNANETVEA
jgi:hypothetical protein